MSGFDNLKNYRETLKNLSGANAAEVYFSRSTSFKVGLRDGEIDTYDVSKSAGLSLRAENGRIGYAYTEYPDDDPQRLLALAIANAASVESKDEQMLYKGADGYSEEVGIDPRLLAATAKQKIDMAYQLERLALSDKRIQKLKHCVVATGSSENELFNSLGLNVADSSGYAIAYCSPVGEKDGVVKNGFAFRAEQALEDIDLEGLAKEAIEDTICQFDASPVPSGKYSAVLKNSAAADLLGAFSSMFSAEAAQKGLSLLAGKEGETIAAACVSLKDEPLHPLSLNRSRFDAEGVPSQSTTLVENGVFKTLLYNLKTAKKAGINTTGNAGKATVASPIDVSPSNLFIVPGTKTQEQLLARMGSGLFIAEFSGLHAGTNAVSGQFSLLCRGGLVENGKIVRSVEQITFSGEFIGLLKAVVDVGSDLRFDLPGTKGCMGAPALLVEGVQISGK